MFILINTDGSADNKKKQEGGAVGIVLKFQQTLKIIAKFYDEPHLNTYYCEVIGILEGLKAVKNKKYDVILCCDNQAAVRCANHTYNPSQFQDKFREIDLQVHEFKIRGANVEIRWVKGHNKDKYNELADKAANWARKNRKNMEITVSDLLDYNDLYDIIKKQQ